jgi:hypothetical protein
MKKLYSTIMLLAMMVAALGFTACGGDDDDDNGGGSGSKSIVGVWELVSVDSKYEMEGLGGQMELNADGTLKTPSGTGKWKLEEDRLSLIFHDGTQTFTVISLTSTQLVLSLNDGVEYTLYFKRVNGSGKDDTPSASSNDDYIEVTLNGKTYKEKLYNGLFAQIEPVGRDKSNRPLTFTYDMVDHFDGKGFSFMLGIIHYTKKDELLSLSSPGTYSVCGNVLDDDQLSNLVLAPTFDYDYYSYNLQSGTNQVKSIKEVKHGVRITGSFTTTFAKNGDVKTVKGSYAMTIPY